MLNNKDYCDYETCVALKELGYQLTLKEFRYEGNAVFVPGVLLYSAQKWLREAKDIIVYPEKNSFGWYCAVHYNVGKVCQFKYLEECDSYEDALLKGIKEAIKILKDEQTN